MDYKLPLTIENCIGEKLTFLAINQGPEGERVMVENFVAPGVGPVMHTHWLQDEELTILHGELGYQLAGQPEQFAQAGETVLFKRGTPHRFWNSGKDTLHCKGWITPAHSIIFFLSAIFAAQNKSGSSRPETFDAAYLVTRYATEYDLPEIPKLVKKTIIPLTYFIGKLLGKYKHFENAPAPVM